MKGIVFTMFSELIEEKFGFETWDDLIDATEPESEGIYVSTDVYPDSELLDYVSVLSKKLDIPSKDLVFVFGEHMIGQFQKMHPGFFEGHTLKTFLKSVHDVIHVEVKKLHPDAVLPSFEYEDTAENELTMIYKSPRKMCALAAGLVSGAAFYFDTPYEYKHDICMHNGADNCRLEFSFQAANVA